MGDKKIRMDAQLFFQSNADLLEVLIKDLIRLARKADPTRAAADIYCGVGTFSVFLSDIFPSLTLVEQNPRSLELAKQNLAGKRAEFYPLSESEWVTKQKKGAHPFGFMVLDPPRLGLSSILRDYIAQRGPPLVAYVSCDPATLARDTKELVAGAYTLGALTLYDFYPQTAHIETLAFFERSS
jgi:23S rRNA (uracil1939-C5)-methyltransferase